MQPPLLATIQHWLLTALHCSLPATLNLTSLFAIKGLRRIVAARLIGQSSLGEFSHSAEEAHIAMGKALASLRDEGVLIGSGNPDMHYAMRMNCIKPRMASSACFRGNFCTQARASTACPTGCPRMGIEVALMCVSFIVATRARLAADMQPANACASCAAEFDAYLQSAVEAASPAEREAKLQAWLSAPRARACQP